MKTELNIATAIEKNRIALLREILCWLALAICVRLTRKMLPPRLAAYASMQIAKAELAVGFLIIASGKWHDNYDPADRYFVEAANLYQNGFCDVITLRRENDHCLTFIIARLRAVRSALVRLVIRDKALVSVPLQLKHRFAPAVFYAAAFKALPRFQLFSRACTPSLPP
ncbi:MAG: hypothetical protein U5K75_04160 [Ahrensia sp.]|nr:hypothetical protein [Ahrensia sp.]